MNPSLHQLLHHRRQKATRRLVTGFTPPRLVRPLIIVSAPRSGSTLLFETLAHFSDLWTIGEESHEILEGIPALHPAASGFASNRLTAADATTEIIGLLQDRFARQLQDRSGRQLIDLPPAECPAQVRLLEKTPKNALRIPFLRAIFPDAHFLFLYRDPAENISSILEGWQSQRFIAYRSLLGWPRGSWSFLLPSGWETLREKSVVEIAAYQWQAANTTIVEDLSALPRATWSLVRYRDLVREPRQTIQRIAQRVALPWDRQIEERVAQSLPHSSMTLSAPAADKWRKHASQLEPLLPALEPVRHQVDVLAGKGNNILDAATC